MAGDNSIEILSPIQSHAYLESWYELLDESHFWVRWRLEALMQQLRDLNVPIHDKLNVLDVGCSIGVLRSQLEAVTAWTIDLTDLDYNALQQAQPGRGRILYYDILKEKAELKERYNVVVLFDVLEHIEQTQPFIKALLFHLKIGGFLLINVPAVPSLYSRYDEVAGHIRRYTQETLTKEFRDFPVAVRDVRYWGLINVPVLLARKLLLSLFASQGTEKLFQHGFKPPNRLVNEVFLRLMRLEMALTKRPPLGASVLLVAEKTG